MYRTLLVRLGPVWVALAACQAGDGTPTDSPPDLSSEYGEATPAGAACARPGFDKLAAAVEADLERSNATGASVAVWLDDQIVWVGGFGDADPAGQHPRRPDENTQFAIGSDTKKVAAILYLQQVAAGEASLDTTLADVLPDLVMARAPDYVGATAHELLSHQGGIVDTVGEYTTTTTDDVLRSYTYGGFARDAYALAPHGLFFNYSNPNFSMAGLMTETVAAEPWADLAEDRLFARLGMSRSVARRSEVDGNRSSGVGYDSYTDTAVGPVAFEASVENAFVRPAGFVWSTPGDQVRLARFLVDGDRRVLPDRLLARIHQPQARLYPDIAGDYGYGLFVSDSLQLDDRFYPGVELWYHGGNTLTHTSTFVVLPEERFAISILSNGYGDDFSASVVAAIDSLVTLPRPTAPPPPPFDASRLDSLVGTYHEEFLVGDLIITRAGDRLEIAAPALDAARIPYEHAMTPYSTRIWLMVAQGRTLELDFFDGPDGSTYLVNRSFVAVRPPPSSARPPARAIGPTPGRETILRALRLAELAQVPVARLAGEPR